MTVLSAENNFRRGLAALVDDNHRDAAVFFARAIEIQRQRAGDVPEPRYLSYYGFSLAKSRAVSREALDACARAAASGGPDPDLYLNLGRVYLLAGKTALALEAFSQGLRLVPGHAPLARELGRIDRRSAPVLPLLGRDHALNRYLGRLRAAVRRDGLRLLRAAGLV